LSVVSGGYVGVDVFFVISGFLITSVIMRGIENDTFSFVHFYERRARRLLPDSRHRLLSRQHIDVVTQWLFPNIIRT